MSVNITRNQWTNFLDTKRSDLVKSIEIEHGDLLDDLRSAKILADEPIQHIQGGNTPQDRVRRFLEVLRRINKNNYFPFIKVFHRSHPDIAEEAAEQLGVAQYLKPVKPEADTSKNTSDNYGQSRITGEADAKSIANPGIHEPPASSQGKGDVESCSIPIAIQKADSSKVELVKKNAENYYKMSARPRGRAIILNNQKFDESPERTGSSVDAENLTKLFTQLGFETSQWKDYTAWEIKSEIEKERQSAFHKNADCFVFIALSHGERGMILGTDGKEVHLETEIISAFDGKNCRQLCAKPKLFFIQACQGARRTDGYEVEFEVEADGRRMSTHEKADTLVMNSTAPGYLSWRNSKKGAWFVQELVKNINEHAHEMHLIEILTMVTRDNEKHETKDHDIQISPYQSTLRKFLYFLPGHYE